MLQLSLRLPLATHTPRSSLPPQAVATLPTTNAKAAGSTRLPTRFEWVPSDIHLFFRRRLLLLFGGGRSRWRLNLTLYR